MEKRCSRCREIKTLDEFGKYTNSKDGRHYYCRLCSRIIANEKYSQKPSTVAVNTRTVKSCSRCREAKTLEEFGNHRKMKDGKHYYCKCCMNAIQKEKYAKKPIVEPVTEGSKICSHCKIEKPAVSFSKAKRMEGGRDSKCKECVHEYYLARFAGNPEYLKKCADRSNANYHKRRLELGVAVLTAESNRRRSEFKKNQPDKYIANVRKWDKKRWSEKREDVLGYQRAYKKKKYATDPNFKLSKAIRRMVHITLKGQGGLSVMPYTANDLRVHLEALWRDGMTWENWGPYWQIDHIKPISLFIREGCTDPVIINAISNLQPLTTEENRIKGDSYSC